MTEQEYQQEIARMQAQQVPQELRNQAFKAPSQQDMVSLDLASEINKLEPKPLVGLLRKGA